MIQREIAIIGAATGEDEFAHELCQNARTVRTPCVHIVGIDRFIQLRRPEGGAEELEVGVIGGGAAVPMVIAPFTTYRLNDGGEGGVRGGRHLTEVAQRKGGHSE